jgi:hypothetical protein
LIFSSFSSAPFIFSLLLSVDSYIHLHLFAISTSFSNILTLFYGYENLFLSNLPKKEACSGLTQADFS